VRRPAYLNLKKFLAMPGNCRDYLHLSGFYQGCRNYINLPRLHETVEIPYTSTNLENVLRSVKDTRENKSGNLFYVSGEMLKRNGRSRNVLLSFEKDRGHFNKGGGHFEKRSGNLEECEVSLKPWGLLDEKDGFIETSRSRVAHGRISKLDSLSKGQGWSQKDDPFQISRVFSKGVGGS
jgi:hypothetical protein